MRYTAIALLLSASVLGTAVADTYVNPSGIVLGETAVFIISIQPDNLLPDSDLIWRETPQGSVSFPHGRTGRRVVVKGEREGDVTLRLEIADYYGPTPTIQAKVVAPSVVDAHIYIVCSTNGHAATEHNRVTELFSGVNDIWRQVGLSFRITGFESVTNDFWLQLPKAYGTWPVGATLVNHTNAVGGIECYFVDWIEDANALNYPGGLVVSSNGSFRTVGHELGHACGLKDIYERHSGTSLVVSGAVSRAMLGTEWGSNSDAGFYAPGTQQANLLKHLLMYGFGNSFKADIPYGDITGLWYDNLWDSTNHVWRKSWHLSPAPVGFFLHGNPTPSHQ